MWGDSFRYLGIALAILTALTFSNNALAQWYAGVEGTNIKYKVEFTGFHEYYDLEPVRVFGGYTSGTVGFELQAYSNASDTIIDIASDEFETEIEDTYGVMIRLSTEDRNWYGLIGAIRTTVNYTNLTGPGSARDTAVHLGATIGFQYEILENLRVSANYNYFEGKTNLIGVAATGPGLTTKVDSKLTGLGLGFNYSF